MFRLWLGFVLWLGSELGLVSRLGLRLVRCKGLGEFWVRIGVT